MLTTHKGLYHLNRVLFGVASAPAIWQCTMDNALKGLQQTQCIVDNIILTGKDDDEPLANLEAVLKRL